MTCRIDADIRTYKTVITNVNKGFVKHRPVEVGKETLAYMDMLAIIAIEGLVDEGLFIASSQYFVELLVSFPNQRGAYPVILPTAIFTLIQIFQ